MNGWMPKMEVDGRWCSFWKGVILRFQPLIFRGVAQMSTHWPMVYLLKKEGSYYPAIDDNSKSNLWTGFGAILWRRISKGVCNVWYNAMMEKNGKQQKVYSDEFVHVDREGDPLHWSPIKSACSILMSITDRPKCSSIKTGVINFTYVRGIKQYKCILMLTDLPIMIHCLGR